jgi:ribonuclease J
MRLFQKLARPKYFMPIHGEYRMLKLHAGIAVECGMPKDHTFVCANGDVLTLINHKVTVGKPIQADSIFIDGRSTVGVANSIIRDRSTLINEGMIGIYLVIDQKTGRLVYTPVLESEGFNASSRKSLAKKAGEIIAIEVNRLLSGPKKATMDDIKAAVRQVTGRYIYRETRRNPIIIPVILTADTGKLKA